MPVGTSQEGDEFPELVADFHEQIVRRGLDFATGFLKFKQKEAGVAVPDHDPEALVAIALGSIINYRVEESLFGQPPGSVSEERFVKPWVDVWGTYGDNLVRAGLTRREGWRAGRRGLVRWPDRAR